jgi:hypothetical protein
MDFGTFATGIFTGFASSTILALLFKGFMDEGIRNWFATIQQSRGLVGSAEIEYRQQQLSELYGPLYAYLQGGEPIYKLWMAGKLHHVNDTLKKTFREQNEAMIAIIRTKSHLIDEPTFPREMASFITSISIWNAYTSQQDGLPPEVAALDAAKFPEPFVEYIYAKTRQLKADLEELYKKYEVK